MYVQRGFISSNDIERRWKMKKLTAFKYTEKDSSINERDADQPHLYIRRNENYYTNRI